MSSVCFRCFRKLRVLHLGEACLWQRIFGQFCPSNMTTRNWKIAWASYKPIWNYFQKDSRLIRNIYFYSILAQSVFGKLEVCARIHP